MDSPQDEVRLLPLTGCHASVKNMSICLLEFGELTWRDITLAATLYLENRQMQTGLHQKIQQVDLAQCLLDGRGFAFLKRN
jgi:hypothetical protein